MRDKRPVDELSIEELERILAIRKREARQQRLRRYEDQGRRLPIPAGDLLVEQPRQHEAAQDLPPVEPPVTYDLTDEIPRFEDELEDEFEEHSRKKNRPPQAGMGPTPRTPVRRQGWDRFLLIVEVLGVLGIVGVLAAGGYLLIIQNNKIEELERKSAVIQQEAEAMRPTPSPAPLLSVSLSNYVLPGGHYSPDQTGGIGAFNLDELPESVRPAAMAQLNAPQAALPTPQPISPKGIVIPKIGVNATIYAGDDWFALQKGVGHLLGSANPGERGNMVLTAHNDIYGEIFRYIENLEPGDEIRIQDNSNHWYTYIVQEKQIVKPTDTWVMERGSEPIVTLITCYPYRVDNRRIVVFAKLLESTP